VGGPNYDGECAQTGDLGLEEITRGKYDFDVAGHACGVRRGAGGDAVEREFLQLPIWDQFTAREAEFVGRALARCLPAPWAFDGVEFHEMGDQKRHVAFFTWKGTRFALIPGGEVTLGYDRHWPFVPDSESLAEWQRNSKRESDMDWAGFLDRCLTPLRRVTFAPFLLETEAAPCERVRGPGEGVPTFDELCAALATDGFRPPTSDEWEYACSGGARALWRWGDQLDPLQGPDGRSPYSRPNAFGLRIAFDSYKYEVCGPPPVWRGGDGGVSVCGGEGLLAWQITLASAYYEPDGSHGLDYANVRRTFPLPPDCLD
jgi:hypothetical protein